MKEVFIQYVGYVKKTGIVGILVTCTVVFSGIWLIFKPIDNPPLTEEVESPFHEADTPRASLLYTKEETFSILKRGTLVNTFQVGDTARLGTLQITLYDAHDSTYKSLELDENNQRVYKDYFRARVRVYNTGYNSTEDIVMGLEDDLGNQYIMDHSFSSYLDGITDFGWARNVISQTLREGYLLFPPIHKEAHILQLTFMSQISNKKIIFEIER